MKRSIAVVLSAQLTLLGASGCATVNTDISRTRPPEGASGPGSVRVTIFEKRAQVSAGIPAGRPVTSTLSRLEDGVLVPVHEDHQSSWSLPQLPPGKYVFAITGWTDAKGRAQTERVEEGFRLSPGETAAITAVLEDRRRSTMITTAAVAGGGLVGYGIYALARTLFSGSWNLSGSR